ncbi:ATP-binding protein [Streptomyces sp. SAJ15]|uniref:ATP-binding protein n=1 Tax=Streptomyces sp. SAJ15 TaxID=2011095 RepID=UPI001184BD3F|nr:ATP-binding protein [Streptomyces sp. SAJ15]TVL91542.1 hypothetical protein CD790_16480 [Streptomyces sp. SAJ15]
MRGKSSSATATAVDVTLTLQQIEEWSGGAPPPLDTPWRSGHPVAFSLPSTERGVPACRRLARSWLDSEQVNGEGVRYAFLLVLSELVTNAVRHSRSALITGRFWRASGLLFVEVRDQGGTPSRPRVVAARRSDAHGRGLALIAATAYAWGRRGSGDGGCAVWAAVPLTPVP